MEDKDSKIEEYKYLDDELDPQLQERIDNLAGRLRRLLRRAEVQTDDSNWKWKKISTIGEKINKAMADQDLEFMVLPRRDDKPTGFEVKNRAHFYGISSKYDSRIGQARNRFMVGSGSSFATEGDDDLHSYSEGFKIQAAKGWINQLGNKLNEVEKKLQQDK